MPTPEIQKKTNIHNNTFNIFLQAITPREYPLHHLLEEPPADIWVPEQYSQPVNPGSSLVKKMASTTITNHQNQGPGPPLPIFSHFSSGSSELSPIGRLRRWCRVAVLRLRTVWGRLRHHTRALTLGPDMTHKDDDDALIAASWERPRYWPPVAPPRPVRPEVAARRAARAAARAERERWQQQGEENGEETALLSSFTAARLSLMEEDEVERLLRLESEG